MAEWYVLVFIYSINPLTNNSSTVIPYPYATLDSCKQAGDDMTKQLGTGKYSCTIVYPSLPRN